MDRMESGGWNYLMFKGRLPLGVVLIHEIKGVDDYARSVGEQLSNEGYWVILPDLFRGRTAIGLEDGAKIRDALTKQEVLDAISHGADILHEHVGGSTVGTMGFCMGGGFALLGASNLNLDFCVDYYGMIEDAEEVEGLIGPTQLVLGTEDKRVTPWACQKLIPAMVEHKKRLDLHLYPSSGHAFHRPDWAGHNAVAAKDAWSKTMRFLRFQMENRP